MMPVITGIGLVSSLGGDVATALAAYRRGESAIHPLRAFDRAKYRTTNAYEIDDRPNGHAGANGAPDLPGRASRWLRAAVGQAVEQAGLTRARRPKDSRVPLIVGTGLAEQRSLELWWTAGAAVTLDELHFGGACADADLTPTFTIVNACSASLFALAVGADLLELGEADAVVVAGADAISESMFGLLDRVTPHPPAEVRPFDAERRGVILGEGAVAVVLERPAAARRRGAVALAAVRGVATTCDAHHETAPLRRGVGRTFREAHRRAGVQPGEIDLIMAHGTGTALNDATEAMALRDVFRTQMGRPLVTALKSLIGHTSGASGLMSLVVAIEAMAGSDVPPTLNHVTPMVEVDGFRFVIGSSARTEVRRGQIDAFGFGGMNAVAVVDRASAAEDVAETTDRVAPDRHRAIVVTGVGLAAPGLTQIRDLLALADRRDSVARSSTPPEFDAQAKLGRRGLRYKDRATRLALCAVAEAMADARLAEPFDTGAPSAFFGVVVSSTLAVADTVCRVVDTIHDGGTTATSSMDLPNVSPNVAAASVAIWFGLAGHNLTVSAGPTSGVDAIHLAATAIRAGRAQRMVVIGVEPASDVGAQLIAATAERHDGGRPAPGMFDGAAAVVLEGLDDARAREARPLALVDRYAQHARLDESVSAVLDTGPGGAGTAQSMWLQPCLHHPSVAEEVALTRSRLPAGIGPVDLSVTTGEASGALGVLQAAVAASWLAEHPRQDALISCGGCWGGNYASLGLRSAV